MMLVGTVGRIQGGIDLLPIAGTTTSSTAEALLAALVVMTPAGGRT
jgi:hypothetical protein